MTNFSQGKEQVSGYKKVMLWIKTRYQLSSDFDVLLVLILFSITGSSAVKVSQPLLIHFGITHDLSWYVFWPIRILIVFVMYQMLFVFFGFLIGLISKPIWNFAWSFEQKMLSRFGIKFK
jgi:hypothetical protein